MTRFIEGEDSMQVSLVATKGLHFGLFIGVRECINALPA
jgi:hypothetical protein